LQQIPQDFCCKAVRLKSRRILCGSKDFQSAALRQKDKEDVVKCVFRGALNKNEVQQ